MSQAHLTHLSRSYRLFPNQAAVVTIIKRNPSWLSNIIPSWYYMKEWAGVVK